MQKNSHSQKESSHKDSRANNNTPLPMDTKGIIAERVELILRSRLSPQNKLKNRYGENSQVHKWKLILVGKGKLNDDEMTGSSQAENPAIIGFEHTKPQAIGSEIAGLGIIKGNSKRQTLKTSNEVA